MGQYPTRKVNVSDIVNFGERLQDPAPQPNPAMSILHIKWLEPKKRISKPQILPDEKEVGFDQEILIQHSTDMRLGADSHQN